MSSTTPNLGLVLYDSSTDLGVTFATFRAVWGGPASTSNFYKIDTAIGTHTSQISALQNTRGAIAVPATFISANYYEATVAAITAHTTNMTIVLSVDTTSSGTVTLNINGLGIKSVMKVNSSGTAINLTGSDLVKGRQYLFIYDGTRWLWVSANSADQIQIVGTAGNVVTVGSDNSLLGTTTQAGLIADTSHAATGKTTPVDADEIPLADSAASFVLKKLTWSNLKATLKSFFDNLYLRNYIITPSIGSNNLTVAIKTLAAGDASSTNPITFKVGDTIYTLTAAAGFTANAGTNWMNCGGAELAGNAVDFFVYAIGETGASAGLKFGISRLAASTVMGDFVNTNTSEKYIAGSWTNFNATDKVQVIGRFRAQLSAGASYNWSIASALVINYPIHETGWLTWTPVHTGFTATVPSGGAVHYQLRRGTLQLNYAPSVVGVSNATGYTITAPFISKNISQYYQYFSLGWTYDNGASVATGSAFSSPNSNVITITKSALGTWTNTGNKIAAFTLFVEIE